MSNWKQQYEDAADAEYARHASMSVSALLAAVRAGQTGEYYTIWRVLAQRAGAGEAAVLLDYLLADHPYLDRYHCASALLKLLRCQEFQAAELSIANRPTAAQRSRLLALVTAARDSG